MKITIGNETSKNPLEIMGKYAGDCWGADTNDKNKNIKRGKNCIADGHGRVAEFPQIFIKIEGESARFCRELYTHIGGSPTRLQASTRYINYQKGFEYITPSKINKNKDAKKIYDKAMDNVVKSMQELEKYNIPREDIANLLPLGMTSTMMLRTNLRMLISMSRQRMCNRALWEFRDFMNLLCQELSKYDKQYEYIIKNYFGAKCEFLKYCPESKSCGKYPKK